MKNLFENIAEKYPNFLAMLIHYVAYLDLVDQTQ